VSIELPPLPFKFDAFAPVFSSETLYFHYEKHHAGYIKKLNKLIKDTEYENLKLTEIVKKSFENKDDLNIFNNAAQAWNHNFYWHGLKTKGPSPTRALVHRLEQNFGSTDSFIERFQKMGLGLFGSGYVWLVKNEDGSLEIIAKENAYNPLVDQRLPLLACDVWEHAYYLDVQNDRKKYLENFTQFINWDFIEQNLEDSTFVENGSLQRKTKGEFDMTTESDKKMAPKGEANQDIKASPKSSTDIRDREPPKVEAGKKAQTDQEHKDSMSKTH
jgi:superoxide dismutase, Fe-Mn family